MKTFFLRNWLGIVLVCLAAALGAKAQEFEEPPPLGPPPDEMPPPGALDSPKTAGPPPGPEAPVDIWMNRMHQRNPDEFRRFQRMRHQDPEGFRKELVTRLGRKRLEASMAAHPRLRAFLETLPEPERMDVILALSRALRPEGPPTPPNESAGPETRQLREDINRLAGECRKTDDPAQREKLQAELRVKLGEMFDTREKERERHISRIQSEIAKLQQMLESRRASREEIIERRLRELTEDETLQW
ncbi:MAG: hypothetical protein KJ726_03000 [Verrucomicrobia bacterium]|nr:hypothetical protein [Verrucomicrobiota bacterium]MBU1908994.1 hypothetical protein [Verrucomicrobiota bacterium]